MPHRLAAGFIGGHLAEELLRQGYEVTGLDDFSSGKRARGSQAFAGEAGGARLLLRGVRRRAGAAQARAFAAPPDEPYAAQKIACELYAQTYTAGCGLPCVALRFFNVYGPRQDPKSEYAAAIPRFATRLLAGERPIVFGDGLQTRDFVHVSDVVRANLLAAQSEKAPGETINVGSGHSATLVELIQLLRQAVGPQAAGITIEHQAPRVGDLRASSADISKARALLGYVPRVQLAEGLAGVVDFFRSSIKKAA